MLLNLVRYEDLHPEQKAVLNLSMASRDPVMLVQGVAGAGKTTLALNMLIELYRQDSLVRPPDRTAVLITYNKSLQKYCRDQLVRALPTETYRAWMAADSGTLEPGRINILTYSEFL